MGLITLSPFKKTTSTFVDAFSTNFNGNTQGIKCGNNLAYEFSQAWTISCWIKAANLTQNYHTIVSKVLTTPYRGYEMQIKNQTIEVDIAASITNYIEVNTSSNVITSTSTWYHVAWTNSGSGTAAGQKIYINGSSVSVGNLHDNLGGSTIINASADFAVGNRSSLDIGFTGIVDDCSMFDAALSAGQITTLYNSGHPGDLTGMSNLQYWCWMGDGDSATTSGGYLDHSGHSINGTGNNMTSGNIVSDHP